MTAKKMTDVSKPDSTPADATSKPIILGHKPMVSDPMVSGDTKEKPAAKQSMASTARSIQPVSEEFTKKAQAEEPETDSGDDTDIVPVRLENIEAARNTRTIPYADKRRVWDLLIPIV